MERDFLIEVYDAQEHDENESLSHHGVNGMHWGIRRYQNKDGSLTPEGRRHWGIGDKIRSAKAAIDKRQKAKKMAALRTKKNGIIARGDVNEILENKHLFTTKELDKAIGRSQRMSMLKAMTPEETKAREKAIKAQEKAARGREAVDRGLYRAGQLVQMAPAMIQCYAIVRGLLGGSSPNASEVASAAASLANPLTPAQNSNSGNSHQNSNNTNQNGSTNQSNPYNSSIPNPYSSSHVPPPSQLHGGSPSSHGSNPLTQVSYNMETVGKKNKYTSSGQDTHNYIHAVDTDSLPSWSNPTTNATFKWVHTASSSVPMSSLSSSTLFSDNTGATMYPSGGNSSSSMYNLEFD